jgi:hypothetical protein
MRCRLILACALLALAAPTTLLSQYYEKAAVNGPVHDGVEVDVDLPLSQHVKNFGAPADGQGLCVFASLDMAARWHRVRPLIDVIHKINQGGGYPEKVDAVMRQVAPGVLYEQYEGTDPRFLDRAIGAGSAVCVTYGYGERYGMQTIYHMVLLVHLDADRAAIIDNNFPGTFEWMSRDEFLRRWVHPTGKGWAVALLAPPPPPPPRSLARAPGQ